MTNTSGHQSSPAYGSTGATDAMTGNRSQHDRGDLIAASRVKGTNVYDKSGEKIGSIDDIMVGKRNGEVAYAVMSFGGFLGIGEKFHPLPWDALDYDTEIDGYRVGAAGEKFRDAPSYSREGLEDQRWSEDTDRYYNDRSTANWLDRRDTTGVGSAYGTTQGRQ